MIRKAYVMAVHPLIVRRVEFSFLGTGRVSFPPFFPGLTKKSRGGQQPPLSVHLVYFPFLLCVLFITTFFFLFFFLP